MSKHSVLKAVFCVVLATLFLGQAQARIIHVPGDSSTIQAGINGAVDGDTVLVAEGHYYERISFNGKGILVASEFVIDSDTMHIINTVMDGDTTQTPLVSDTGSVVRFVNGEDSLSVLTGFTIKHGIGSPTEDLEFKICGGGIYSSAGCSPKVSYCVIDSNSAEAGYGGGIYSSGNPVISNCRITNNYNGGIFLNGYTYDTAMVVGCMVSRNSLFGIGYGYYYSWPSPTITDDTIENNLGNGIRGRKYGTISGCIIRGNSESGIYLGGGVSYHEEYAEESRAQIATTSILNCAIENNGEGIHLVEFYRYVIEGCLIKDNNLGMYSSMDPYIDMKNCIVIGNIEGGIFSRTFDLSIANCVFANNSAEAGGAISGNRFRITNCTFVGNSAPTGSVIYGISPGAHAISSNGDWLQNCILAFNLGGEPIVCDGVHTPPSIAYTDIFGNEGGDWVGCIADQADTNGNFSSDPQFCDTASNNYYLSNLSPCVGAGEGGADIGAFGVGCGMELTPGPDESGSAQTDVTVEFYLRNMGFTPDICDLNITDSLEWTIIPTHYQLSIDSGEVDTVTFGVSIPSVPIGTVDKLRLRVVSQADSTVADTAYLLVTCGSYNITIRRVTDVGNDQGKQVHIEWLSFPGSDPLVTNFSVLRREDSLLTSPPAARPAGHSLRYPPGQWEWLVTIPASGETLYSVVVPTLKDSTIAEGMYWSLFFIRAGTANPILYFDSPVDSGYSLDNLFPSPPTGLFASHLPAIVKLVWNATTAPDFDYYTVYRDTSSGFAPDTTNRLDFTIDTVLVDSTGELGKTYYYLVSATDFSGNESDPSNQAMGACYITGDANGDGLINASDVVYLINYLFIGGPAPNPLGAGDINCDGLVNASDVVYLINYLFIGGPPPGC
jgi:hypothetical protein